MKMLKNIAVLLCLGFASCSGFLDEMDQDKFIPTKVDHYASLLLQEFNVSASVMSSVEGMTDEVQDTEGKIKLSAGRTNMKPLYTWQRDIELIESSERVSNNQAWEGLYRDIAVVTYVIELVDEAEGTQEEIDYVKGEAYFIRAYCYFNLINLYAEPYRNVEQAKTTYGVPLRLDIGVNTTYDKSMLYDGYKVIELDLEEAKRLISASGLKKSIYHPTVKACDLLFSRIKLYKKEYEEVIRYATDVISSKALVKLSSSNVGKTFINKENSELFYSFSQEGGGLSTLDLQGSGFVVNNDLLTMYDDSDLRRQLFFQGIMDQVTGVTSVYPRKMDRGYSVLGFCNFRVAEAYLNRAEAYAYGDRIAEAQADMLQLLTNRYTDPSEINIPSEKSKLIAFIHDERFKELCFEAYHRWFDLRRMEENERPVLTHKFTIVNDDGNRMGTEIYKLLRNDKNYTLSVPAAEKDRNQLIRDYERFDKLPDYNAE